MVLKMKTLRKTASFLIAFAIIISLFAVPAMPAAAASGVPALPFNSTYDYFADRYPALQDTEHVFKTAEYYEFKHLLSTPSEKPYVFLIGGTWSESTQAAIGYINEVALEYKVPAIYNFDPKLDANTFDIQASETEFSNLYISLVNSYLTNLSLTSPSYVTRGATSAQRIESPFLFTYKKGAAPIISYLEEQPTAADLNTSEKADAYKARVAAVFDAVATDNTADTAYLSDSDYFYDVFNSRYAESYGTVPARGQYKPFEAGHESNLFEAVTLDELTGILSSQGNYAILFGGMWCHNTWAVAALIDDYAKKSNIDKIYVFDTVLDGESQNDNTQIRSSNKSITPLYTNLVNGYLTNIHTLSDDDFFDYTTEDPSLQRDDPSYGPFSVYYIPAGATSSVWASRIQLPYFFTYNKDAKDNLNASAPILGYVEQMHELWNMQSGSDEYKEYLNGFEEEYWSGYTSFHPGLEQVFKAWVAQHSNALIKSINAIDKSLYTSKSVKALTDAASALNAALSASGFSYSSALAAYAAAEQAVADLVLKTVNVNRFSGGTRIDTANSIARQGWPEGAKTVILANGRSFPDSLAGGPLAKALDAPLLLTSNVNALEESVLETIKDLKAEKVVILGGGSSVKDEFEKLLHDDKGLEVERYAGGNRYETAVKIAKALAEINGGFDTAFLANGNNFPDALAGAPVAALEGQPILFTNSGEAALRSETATYFDEINVKKVVILGGGGSVPDAVESKLKAALGNDGVLRLFGGNRYQTAVAINTAYKSSFTAGAITITAGANFPDALAGSAYSAKIGAPLFLLQNTIQLDDVAAAIKGFTFSEAYVYGGESSLDNGTVDNHIA
jgi:putative cell wall-binding protein